MMARGPADDECRDAVTVEIVYALLCGTGAVLAVALPAILITGWLSDPAGGVPPTALAAGIGVLAGVAGTITSVRVLLMPRGLAGPRPCPRGVPDGAPAPTGR